ncbi:MAG: hypothetical protein HN348_17925, partial [Proteobacteria bacterium]|nr:hypothetical protein [Pseudomonadota bacterium]
VGVVVVAIVGVDLTIAHLYRARANKPGVFFLPGMEEDKADLVVEELTKVLKEARKHAHVVLLSPHWGDNGVDEPVELTRELARGLIKAGYDGIFAHSSHLVHGAELIDGKPVFYDLGNLVLDYGGGDAYHQAILAEAEFSQVGITQVRVHPLKLNTNQAVHLKGGPAQRNLNAFISASEKLGNHALVIEGNMAVLPCEPGRRRGPRGSLEPPQRPRPDQVRLAPVDRILDSLPANATPIDVSWENGMRLVGYDVFLDKLSVPKGGNIVSLYWTTSQPLGKRYFVRIEERNDSGKRLRQDHLPGDWLLPTEQWPVGPIIHDRTLTRLTFDPKGDVQFLAGVMEGKKLMTPTGDAATLTEDLVHLSTATYTKGAPRLFEALHALEGKP